MYNAITIRKAEPEDVATIAYFSRKTFLESYGDQTSKKDMEKFFKLQFSVKNLMSEVKRRHITILLAYRLHTLVGYALMREVQNPPEINSAVKGIELARLYVDAAFNGTGVGSAIMKACISLARLKNKEMLWLGVWPKSTRAINFYTKWGFQECGSRVFLLGDDPQVDWIMKKDLHF